ncbi:molecular chaperone [Providencia rettgeri]|nr:molecular chaperone [Providencia rettgeri]
MNIFYRVRITWTWFFLFLFSTFSTQAGVMIGGTRIVYEGNKKEASILISNPDNVPYLIQSWLEGEAVFPENVKAGLGSEFIITPPLFRLNADTTNALRIVKVGELPNDRESVYWLNIKSIPTSDPDAQNQLLISVNTRIKLFYRPAELLQQDAATAYQRLIFSYQNGVLVAKNPTPFYVSLQTLMVDKHEVERPGMVAPFGEQRWGLTSMKLLPHASVTWSAINDFGGTTQGETRSLQ